MIVVTSMIPADLRIPSLFDVKGKVGACILPSSEKLTSERAFGIAVVTGGGSGIGTMIAAAYVQNGAKVYIAARKEKQLKDVRLLSLFHTIRSRANRVWYALCAGVRRAQCEGTWKLPLLRR